MAKNAGRQNAAAAEHVFVQESVYPTNPDAIARIKRGDTVPFEDCEWARGLPGQTVRAGDFDPFLWSSFLANSLVAPLSEHVPEPVKLVEAAPGPEQQSDENDAPLLGTGEA